MKDLSNLSPNISLENQISLVINVFVFFTRSGKYLQLRATPTHLLAVFILGVDGSCSCEPTMWGER